MMMSFICSCRNKIVQFRVLRVSELAVSEGWSEWGKGGVMHVLRVQSPFIASVFIYFIF
jgi:hypothetical protein